MPLPVLRVFFGMSLNAGSGVSIGGVNIVRVDVFTPNNPTWLFISTTIYPIRDPWDCYIYLRLFDVHIVNEGKKYHTWILWVVYMKECFPQNYCVPSDIVFGGCACVRFVAG